MIIGVIGPGDAGASSSETILAQQVGELLAQHGATVVCGGLGGVMKAVCRGAQSRGGTTIGLLPGLNKTDGNEYLTHPLPTGMGELRNGLIVNAGDAIICIGGSWGTLSEIGLTLRAGKACIALNSWHIDDVDRGNDHHIQHTDTPENAVRLALAAVRRTGPRHP